MSHLLSERLKQQKAGWQVGIPSACIASEYAQRAVLPPEVIS